MNQQQADGEALKAFPKPSAGGAVIVLGAGLMGVPAGLVFALAGYRVHLIETSPRRRDSAVPRLTGLLDFLVAHDLVEHTAVDQTSPRVSVHPAIEEVVSPALPPPSLVIETVYEDLEVKRLALAGAERVLPPDVLMCSVTSGLSISDLAECLQHPERFCGAHFWNPPHLIPLVEVVYGAHTSDDTVAAVCAMLTAVGKKPVVVHRDVPGFIGNRLQHALQREAMAIVSAGIASVTDVDLVVTQGFGRRLGVVGPLAICDMAGLDLVLDVDSYLLRDLDASPDPSPLLTHLVEQGKLGVRTLEGFHRWTEEEVAATLARRDAALIRALQEERVEEERC